FFQAEDGIRDRNVTGVQTCALPISKPNAMPESVTDRLSTRHEHLFMFTKSRRYWFDLDPIREALARPEALDEGIVFGGKNTDVEIGRASCRERVEDSVSERTEAERG